MTAAQQETRSFEAETKQLLNLVAHSLYSNKEVFMRELISNASDAADKLRYEALTDAALFEGDSELKIKITFNKEHGTITLTDNGIGMTRDEVIENLGTIARSGTRAFKELLSGDGSKDSQLIGQFGVGFYSAFIVSDRVVVKTRRAGTKADQGVYGNPKVWVNTRLKISIKRRTVLRSHCILKKRMHYGRCLRATLRMSNLKIYTNIFRMISKSH